MDNPQKRTTFIKRLDRACFNTPTDRQNLVRFTRRLAGWMVIYLASNFWLDSERIGQTALDSVIAFAPSIAFGWSLLAFVRYLREADELARRIQYEAIAFAFGVGMLIMLGYPLFEPLGLSQLNPTNTAGIMSIVWSLSTVANAQRYA